MEPAIFKRINFPVKLQVRPIQKPIGVEGRGSSRGFYDVDLMKTARAKNAANKL